METPVNQILTWLAVSDIFTMLSYVPFAIHFYCYGGKLSERNSHGWMIFMIFHINLTSTTHTISIWMCVLLAVVRYLHIRKPTRTTLFRKRRMNRTKIIILFIYISSSVILIPNYMSNELREATTDDNSTAYVLKDLKLGREGTETMVLVNVWLYAVSAKLVPCLLMSVFGSLLIYNIHVKIRQRRKVLQISGNNCLRLTEHSRTTKMLLAVIVLFLVTEFPQGILIVCSACMHGFFESVYIPLGDVMDIVALVNNSVNFILYCSMSIKFRQTFAQIYCSRCSRGRAIETRVSLSDYLQPAKFDSPNCNNNKLLT